MWTIEIEGDEFKVCARVSEHEVQSGVAPETGTVSGMGAGRHLWHIDVVKEDDRLSRCTDQLRRESCGGGSRMHYAYSLDEGLNWYMSEFLFEQAYEFESQRQYRGSLRKRGTGAGLRAVVLCGEHDEYVLPIAYLRFNRPDDTLMNVRTARGQRQKQIRCPKIETHTWRIRILGSIRMIAAR